MTEAEARAIAARLPGINVRRNKSKGTWLVEARVHTQDGWVRRYTNSIESAVAIRTEMIGAMKKEED